MFWMKKIVSRFLFPVPLSLEFLLVGLTLLWFTRRQRAGKALVSCGAALLLAFSNFFISGALLRPLEYCYPALAVAHSGTPSPAVRFIVVLGGKANSDPALPVSSRLVPDQLARLIEGVRLHREIPGTKLIVTGDHGSAENMVEVAQTLGVEPGDILRLNQPRDTEEECQQVAPLVGSQSFVLVTSASHMPRAVGLCRKRGLQPIPAPTDYLAPRGPLEPEDLVPDGYKLFKSRTAVYEYLGLAWAKMRGKISR